MKIAGIITAAGLSTRMGDFKPLLSINGLPMIVHTVLSMKNAGLDPVCVVVGHRGDEIKPVLSDIGVIIAENPSPETSDMLASIKFGLENIMDSDGFFLLPADMPLIPPDTFKAVINHAAKTKSSYTIPTVSGKRAHPPLIMKDCYKDIMSFTGSGGLPAALSCFAPQFVEAGSAASNKDADYPEDFSQIAEYAKKNLGVSRDVCMELFEKAGLPENIRQHCLAVGELSEFIAKSLIKNGRPMDALLCCSGGMLHDIMRTEKDHPRVGAEFLEKEGYVKLGDVVRCHMTFDGLGQDFDELTVVCLADKLISGTERVSPFERYRSPMEKFPENTETGGRIRRDLACAVSLCSRFEEITGEKLY